MVGPGGDANDFPGGFIPRENRKYVEQLDLHVAPKGKNTEEILEAEQKKRDELHEKIQKAKKTVKNTIQQAERLENLEKIRQGVKNIKDKPWDTKTSKNAGEEVQPAPGTQTLKGKTWPELQSMAMKKAKSFTLQLKFFN